MSTRNALEAGLCTAVGRHRRRRAQRGFAPCRPSGPVVLRFRCALRRYGMTGSLLYGRRARARDKVADAAYDWRVDTERGVRAADKINGMDALPGSTPLKSRSGRSTNGSKRSSASSCRPWPTPPSERANPRAEHTTAGACRGRAVRETAERSGGEIYFAALDGCLLHRAAPDDRVSHSPFNPSTRPAS